MSARRMTAEKARNYEADQVDIRLRARKAMIVGNMGIVDANTSESYVEMSIESTESPEAAAVAMGEMIGTIGEAARTAAEIESGVK